MVILLMGVSGVGKTTVGRLLAERLGCELADADDLHPPANKQKMAAGVPLNDQDRGPWLDRVRAEIDAALRSGAMLVVACSALKEAYRQRLGAKRPGVRLVFLTGPKELIGQRLKARQGHFMPAGLLDSQLADLEEPGSATRIDVSASPREIVAQILAATR
ncbi:MAG: gluconokinase [Phycisphaeraceae bacterium]|nr:gluconokinase [Phycisphaeraceae bacterium]